MNDKDNSEAADNPEYLWDDAVDLTDREIDDYNASMLQRQQDFKKAAEYVASAFSGHNAVEKIMLFGSVASSLQKELPPLRKFRMAGIRTYHECRDIDLAVWVKNLHSLNELRRLRVSAVNDLLRDNGIGVAHHQVDVFILSAAGNKYAGRLCIFGKCPKGKFVCKIPGCGSYPFLQKLPGFEFEYHFLDEKRNIVLFQR